MPSRLRGARKIPVGLAVAAVMLMLNAGTAYAGAGGGLIVDGYEIPSENQTLSQGKTPCATFHASSTDPTTHVLPMDGDFGLNTKTGGGTTTLTITDEWYAGPDGTYSDNTCSTFASVSGRLDVSYTGWTCTSTSGNGTYARTNQEDYSLTGTVTCDDTSTTTVESTAVTVTVSGKQVRCGGINEPTCNHPDAGSNISGDYSWTT